MTENIRSGKVSSSIYPPEAVVLSDQGHLLPSDYVQLYHGSHLQTINCHKSIKTLNVNNRTTCVQEVEILHCPALKLIKRQMLPNVYCWHQVFCPFRRNTSYRAMNMKGYEPLFKIVAPQTKYIRNIILICKIIS